MDDIGIILLLIPKEEGIFPVQPNRIHAIQVKERRRSGVENVKVITQKDRIYIPNELRKKALNWVHHYLCHPDRQRIYKTTVIIIYLNGIEICVVAFINAFPIYHMFKKQRKKYEEIHPKKYIMILRETILCLDLVCPYTITDELDTGDILTAMTFIDPATG